MSTTRVKLIFRAPFFCSCSFLIIDSADLSLSAVQTQTQTSVPEVHLTDLSIFPGVSEDM